MKKPKVINFYGGPGSGKSTTAAAMFAELKYRGFNTEYVQEYAKDATWEKRGEKVFAAQDYIFGKQHFRLARVASEVDFVVTDSPLLLSLVYTPMDFPMPSFTFMVKEAYDMYDNLNVFLMRNKPFQQAGRNQNETEARVLDINIREMLEDCVGLAELFILPFSRMNPMQVVDIMRGKGWIE